jgi:hypothetical protein
MKGTLLIPEMLTDPEWCMLDDAKKAPICRAFDINGTYWDFMASPENEVRRARFNAYMVAFERRWPPDLILQGMPVCTIVGGELTAVCFAGFPWETLAAGSIVVDVGGGVGSACLPLARKFPELKFVVQDLRDPIDAGHRVSDPIVRTWFIYS